jgi:hypothetical protein
LRRTKHMECLLGHEPRANTGRAVQDTLDTYGGARGSVENHVLAVRQDTQVWRHILPRGKGQRIVENLATLGTQFPHQGQRSRRVVEHNELANFFAGAFGIGNSD